MQKNAKETVFKKHLGPATLVQSFIYSLDNLSQAPPPECAVISPVLSKSLSPLYFLNLPVYSGSAAR